MNIWALKGHKVTVTKKSIRNGYDRARDRAEKLLIIGNTYTIEKTHVQAFSTDVYLQEFPGIRFNSSTFINVTEQSPEENAKHPEFKTWENSIN